MSKEKITISVRIDKEVKEKFEAICKAIGFNTSDAINVFVRKVINENGIPFPVRMNKE